MATEVKNNEFALCSIIHIIICTQQCDLHGNDFMKNVFHKSNLQQQLIMFILHCNIYKSSQKGQKNVFDFVPRVHYK